MSISFEVNEIFDPEIKQRAEKAIESCVDHLPKEEVWQAWIYVSATFSRVILKGPTQTRARFFFEDVHSLPEKIRAWIDAYPLR